MHARRGERGQTLVINVLFLVVLIGFVGLVVDGGNLFLQRRSAQGIADAAALAGVQDVTRSTSAAEEVANTYATTLNGDDVTVQQITATSGGTGSCGSEPLPPYSLCVSVQRQQQSLIAQVVGVQQTQVGARAIASARQAWNMGKWLPIGLMDGAWTSGLQISFKPGDTDSPAGTINPDAGPTCKFAGGDTIRDVAKSAAFGGIDACPIGVGDTIPTQTGGTNGPVLQGLTERIGTTNRDSFEDVFEWNADMGRYTVKLPDSPRVGVVPIAEGGEQWTITSGAEMRVVAYGLVYLGDRSSPPDYPVVTGNGKNQKIHMTPVDAILPADWDVQLDTYDPDSQSPVVYSLVS